MPTTLFVRLAVTMTAVMILAVTLAAYLNQMRFQQTYGAMVEHRLDVILETAYRDLHVGLALGLRPSAMDGLPQTLDRALAISADTMAIHVLDCDGARVATAGRATTGQAGTAPTWQDRLDAPRWTMAQGHMVAVAGRRLTDSLGDCAGVLVVEMSTQAQVAAFDAMADRLWRGGTLSLLLLGPLLGGLALVLRRRRAMIARLDADLAMIAAADGSALAAPHIDPRHALTESEARMVASYTAARQALAIDAGPRP